MPTLAGICLVIVVVIDVYYALKLIGLAFEESVLWGLGYLFVPLVALIFIIRNWYDAKGPFLKQFLAIPFFIAAAVLHD